MSNPTPRICDTCRHNHCKPSHYPCVECFPESRERWQERKKKKTPWISVKERLPETDGTNEMAGSVLVYIPKRKNCGQSGIYLGKYLSIKGDPEGKLNFWGMPTKSSNWAVWSWGYFEEPIVTHWMPLPEPPEVND